ncbi:DUF317 domain-containing protein [Streptomyces griseus]|uniref:DUF317 domain-containing protein n=1 Tax=Streptomyces griseus TaxID=1911 RepID=UPI00386CED03|nr:DUF317 domain-containing protein [Streptomyces fimicarius]
MPHREIHASVYIDRHPVHPAAVLATITGPEAALARTILEKHHFRPAMAGTMLLACIGGHGQEPYYAGRASGRLHESGIRCHVGHNLQNEIDRNHPPLTHPDLWLTPTEIRRTYERAHKLHDDIASGQLTISLHADTGTTTAAVGTYADGASVHLHGEDQLRRISRTYDNSTEAVEEFHRLHGDAVRPGRPAPTETEELIARTHAAVSAPTAGNKEIAARFAAESDHRELLDRFCSEHGWADWRTWSTTATHDIQEAQALRAEMVDLPEPQSTRWTVAGYDSPVGHRDWSATACADTPTDVVEALLTSLAVHADKYPQLVAPATEESLAEAADALTEAGWTRDVAALRYVRWTPPHDRSSGFALQYDTIAEDSTNPDFPAWTAWGREAPDRPGWSVRLTSRTPTLAVSAVAEALADQEALCRRAAERPHARRTKAAPAVAEPAPTPYGSGGHTR